MLLFITAILIIYWSESHTSYELSSLSKNIIYKVFTNFNESI